MPVIPATTEASNGRVMVQADLGKKQNSKITRTKKAVSVAQVVECKVLSANFRPTEKGKKKKKVV
jgi:hypothetical protein